MIYLITALYAPGGAQARLAIRDRHLAYLIEREGSLRYGGALLDDSNGTSQVIGMFLALELDSPEDVQAFLHGEPYHAAGLFATIERRPLQQFVPHSDPDFLRNEWRRERARLTSA